MPEIISRKEARARGLKRYFTGKPCKNGHVSERKADKGCNCIACSSVYFKKWRLAHLDYFLAHRRRPESKEKQRIIGKKRDKEANRKRCRAYHAKNKEKRRVQGRKYYYEKIMANPEARKARNLYSKRQSQNGPKNPKDEMQWLRKSQALLRNLKRILKNPHREASTSSQTET